MAGPRPVVMTRDSPPPFCHHQKLAASDLKQRTVIMSSLIPFSFESHSVRAFNINGAPWFVGKDVAEALGYKDPTTAIRSHCKGC